MPLRLALLLAVVAAASVPARATPDDSVPPDAPPPASDEPPPPAEPAPRDPLAPAPVTERDRRHAEKQAAAPLRGIYESVPLRPKDAELIETSADMEGLFRRRGYVLQSGPEVDLVRRVGAAVAPKEPADPYMSFRFAVVDSPVPNAFALPDGQIYVHTGLLAILENEAQLAAVLAHECMHVEGHHSIVNARQARKKAGGMLTLSIVLGDIGSLINIAFEAAILGYGRDLESEADRRAIPRLLDAGYDPREMPRVFELLDQDPEGDRVDRQSAAWSDHPLGRVRRSYTSAILDERADEIAAREASGTLVLGEEGYVVQVAPSAKKTAADLVQYDRPRTALDVAHRLTDVLPDDPDGWALTGDSLVALDARTPLPSEAELTKRAKRAKQRHADTSTAYERARARLASTTAAEPLEANRAMAEVAYGKALALAPAHPGALAGMGRLTELRGDDRGAGRWYARFLREAPATDPRRLQVTRHLQVLTDRLAARGGNGTAVAPEGGTP